MRRRAELGRKALLARTPSKSEPRSQTALDALTPETAEGREALHGCWSGSITALAWWRAATDEINWRRFFDINGLAGIRVERAGGVRRNACDDPASVCARA